MKSNFIKIVFKNEYYDEKTFNILKVFFFTKINSVKKYLFLNKLLTF